MFLLYLVLGLLGLDAIIFLLHLLSIGANYVYEDYLNWKTEIEFQLKKDVSKKKK